jgi:hypothetical protein
VANKNARISGTQILIYEASVKKSLVLLLSCTWDRHAGFELRREATAVCSFFYRSTFAAEPAPFAAA